MAAFSQWTIAMYAWNKEEMQKGVAYPSKAFWNQLLVSALLAISINASPTFIIR